MRDEVTRLAVPNVSSGSSSTLLVIEEVRASYTTEPLVIAEAPASDRELALAYVAEQRKARRRKLAEQLERQHAHAQRGRR